MSPSLMKPVLFLTQQRKAVYPGIVQAMFYSMDLSSLLKQLLRY
jgi:hypothetical protein